MNVSYKINIIHSFTNNCKHALTHKFLTSWKLVSFYLLINIETDGFVEKNKMDLFRKKKQGTNFFHNLTNVITRVKSFCDYLILK